MAAPSEEKLICDQFNLEALTVNQLKVSKLWQTGKMFSLEPKREVSYESIPVPFLFTFRG